MLISGSEVSVAKLFVNNSSGKIGLVGYWDCVCFDEFAGKDKRVDKALVDIMKNYMANRTFSRGIEQLTAEASMVFMGNTQKSVAYMLKHSHFFEPASGQVHRFRISRPHPRLQPGLGGCAYPPRAVHRRLWLYRRLHRRRS